MKKRKAIYKIFYVVLVNVVLLVSGGTAIADPLNILMVLWRGETEAEEGFRAHLSALGIDARMTVVDANLDRVVLAKKLRAEKHRLTDYDFIYSFGTTASVMTKRVIQNKVPHIFCLPTDPVRSKLTKSLSGSGENTTGVSAYVSVRLRVQTAAKVFPIKRIAFLYNPREANSVGQLEDITILGKEMGFEVVSMRLVPEDRYFNRMLQRLIEGKDNVDTIYLPADSFMVTRSEKVMKLLDQTKYHVIGSIKKFIQDGALVGVVADYADLGVQCADLIHKVMSGEDIGALPIGGVRQPQILVNELTLKRLGLSVPMVLEGQVIKIR